MSNLILENIFNKQKEKLDFDFTKSISENSKHSFERNFEDNLPISPESSDWEEIENKLCKMFLFKRSHHLKYFINQVLELSSDINHHPHIAIDHNSVSVVTQTKDINQITELDLNIANKIDEIYEDVNFIMEI